MILKLARCDDCNKPLFYTSGKSRKDIETIAAGYKFNGNIICEDCKRKRSMLTADKEDVEK